MYSVYGFEKKPIPLWGGFFAIKIKPLSYNDFLDTLGFINIPAYSTQLRFYKDKANILQELIMGADINYKWLNTVLQKSVEKSLYQYIPCKKLISSWICFFIRRNNHNVDLWYLLATINHLFVYFDNAIEAGYLAFDEPQDVVYDGEINAIENIIITLMTYAKNNMINLLADDLTFDNYKDKLSYAQVSSIQRLGLLRYAQALNMPMGGGDDDKKEPSTNIEKYISIVALLIRSFVKEGENLEMNEWFSEETEHKLRLRVGRLHWGKNKKSKQYIYFKRGYV